MHRKSGARTGGKRGGDQLGAGAGEGPQGGGRAAEASGAAVRITQIGSECQV